jgi:cytochrome P450
LLTHPDQLEAVRADRSLIPRAIEEGLRWEAPLLSFGRTCTRDTTIADEPIPAGKPREPLCTRGQSRPVASGIIPTSSTSSDPSSATSRSVRATTFCLGIHFARMELRVALEEILDELPNLRLDPDATVHVTGLGTRTTINLPCVWDAAPSSG